LLTRGALFCEAAIFRFESVLVVCHLRTHALRRSRRMQVRDLSSHARFEAAIAARFS
jgi:hypothetical protein